jgi:hypothetical protein
LNENHRLSILENWLSTGRPPKQRETGDLRQETSVPPLSGFLEHLGEFGRFATALQLESGMSNDILQAIGEVEQCYNKTWPAGDNSIKLTHGILGWFYRMQPRFELLLQEKHPLALIIFAYLAVILHELRDMWYLEDWGPHVIGGIYSHLHLDYRHWLRWPAQVIGWPLPDDTVRVRIDASTGAELRP